MVSNQELQSDPSSVSDLKSKVNRLKSQLENKDYTNSFRMNNDVAIANEDNSDFSDNDQTSGYVPTSELFIRPPRVNYDEFNSEINVNANQNIHLNANEYEGENFYDNDRFSIDQSKITSNLIYPSTLKNRTSSLQEENLSQFNQSAKQYPLNINPVKTSPRINRAIVDSKYNNKIVIGDTDKIWDVTKKARQQYSKSNANDE